MSRLVRMADGQPVRAGIVVCVYGKDGRGSELDILLPSISGVSFSAVAAGYDNISDFL